MISSYKFCEEKSIEFVKYRIFCLKALGLVDLFEKIFVYKTLSRNLVKHTYSHNGLQDRVFFDWEFFLQDL